MTNSKHANLFYFGFSFQKIGAFIEITSHKATHWAIDNISLSIPKKTPENNYLQFYPFYND